MKNLYKIGDELYIISSSEKIKENTQSFKEGLNGDWFYNTIYNFIARTGDITSYDFKIILTTDKLLIKDGIQAINDEFIEWFVKNPSCEEVEVNQIEQIPDGITFGMFGNDEPPTELIYKIIIPKEEPKKEYKYIGECKGNDGNGCFMDNSGHDCGCFTRILKEEPKQECECTDECLGYLTKECKRIEEPKQETLEQIDQTNPVTRGSTALVSKQETLEEAKKQQFKYDNLQDAKEISSRIKVVETLEEASENYATDMSGAYYEDLSNSFIADAKWQQERSYSEEEVRTLINRVTEFFSHHEPEEWNEWIEKQFKKK